MMLSSNKKLGQKGEDIACFWLSKNNYEIKKRNFSKLPYGEIDIIAAKDNYLFFIEVKTRRKPGKIFSPEKRINYKKKKSLENICRIYLSENDIPLNSNWQIDVIAITLLSCNRAKIKHFKNAIKSKRV